MEKKQLIIIPPMSESLKRLNEVLESIANEENIEINIIDDLRELSQFLSASGQCLILVSNAKKCITFLQENRFVIAKSHCKTILCTPSEISPKVLTKFTKIGLTENILESSSPKTLVYKVKLLLRSIKSASKIAEEAAKDASEKVVKISQENSIPEEKEFVEKLTVNNLMLDLEEANKKSNQPEKNLSIEPTSVKKLKTQNQEKAIDTHWSSDTKNDKIELVEKSTSKTIFNKSTPKEDENFDQIKNNKNESMIFLSEENSDYKHKKNQGPEIILENYNEKKQKNSTEDNTDEEMMQKFFAQIQDNETKTKVTKKNMISALNLEADDNNKKRNESIIFELEKNVLNSKKKKEIDQEDLFEKKSKTFHDDTDTDTEGYVKIKDKNKDVELVSDESENTKNKKTYEKSENYEKEKKDKDIELDAIENKVSKKVNDLEIDIQNKASHKNNDSSTTENSTNKIRNNTDDSLTEKEVFTSTTLDSDISENTKVAKNETILNVDEKSQKKINETSLNIEINEDELTSAESVELTDAKGKADSEQELIRSAAPVPSRDRGDSEQIEAFSKRKKEKDALQIEAENEKKSRSTSEVSASEEKELALKKLDSINLDIEKNKKESIYSPNLELIKGNKIEDFKDTKQNWDGLLGQGDRSESAEKSNNSKDGMEIDYRRLKKEFEMYTFRSDPKNQIKTNNETSNPEQLDDNNSTTIYSVETNGLDFSVKIVDAIYQKEIKPKEIVSMLANEILDKYHGISVFYNYKLSEKKFHDIFNSFSGSNNAKIPIARKEWWDEFKKNTPIFNHYHTLSMTTWRCSEIIKNGKEWEDNELPSWAEQELKNKNVELIFPYFDGVDRMGLALIFFPEGIDAAQSDGVLTILELARSIFLDTIERNYYSDEEKSNPESKKNNIFGFFSSMFNKKKAS